MTRGLLAEEKVAEPDGSIDVTYPTTVAPSGSRHRDRSTVMASGAYAHPRLTRTAVSVPGRRSGVMMFTPGEPCLVRDASANSLAKSYVPAAVARRNDVAESAASSRTGVTALPRREASMTLRARRSLRRCSCQNPRRTQPADTRSANTRSEERRVGKEGKSRGAP